jgi:hypothetical protein
MQGSNLTRACDYSKLKRIASKDYEDTDAEQDSPKQQAAVKSVKCVAAAASPPVDDVNTIELPVQFCFTEGDALGANTAFHNAGIAFVKAVGYKKADHTVVAQESTLVMCIEKSDDVAMIHKAYQANYAAKLKMLRALPAYRGCTGKSMEAMATNARRVWSRKGKVLCREGAEADAVYYIMSGKVEVTKSGKILSCLHKGSIVGDWGVVNNLPRAATCTVISNTAEILCIHASNFKAVIDQSMLTVLADSEGFKEQEVDLNLLKADAAAKEAANLFTIITRHDRRKAMEKLLQGDPL